MPSLQQHVPPMSPNTHPIHSIGEISTGEEDDNIFNSISGESEGVQGNPETFNNVLSHMQARSESRFSRRFNNTVDRLGSMAENLRGFQMESPAVARPPAVARHPAAQAGTETAETVSRELRGNTRVIDQLATQLATLQLKVVNIESRVTLKSAPRGTAFSIHGATKWSDSRRFLGAHVIISVTGPAVANSAAYVIYDSFAKQVFHINERAPAGSEKKLKMVKHQEDWIKNHQGNQVIKESAEFPLVAETNTTHFPPTQCQCIPNMLTSSVLHDGDVHCESRRLFQQLALEVHHQFTKRTLQELKSIKIDWFPPKERKVFTHRRENHRDQINMANDEKSPPKRDKKTDEAEDSDSENQPKNSPAAGPSKAIVKVPPKKTRKSQKLDEKSADPSNLEVKLPEQLPAENKDDPDDLIVLNASFGNKKEPAPEIQADIESKQHILVTKSNVETIIKMLQVPPECIQSCARLSADMRQIDTTIKRLIESSNSVVKVLQELCTRADTDIHGDREKLWLENMKRVAEINEEVRNTINSFGRSIGRVEGLLTREQPPAVLLPIPPSQGRQDHPTKGNSVNRGCVLCGKPNHPTHVCKTYIKSAERIKRAEEIGICMKCLETIPEEDCGVHNNCPNKHVECRNCLDTFDSPAASNHNQVFCSVKAPLKVKEPAAPSSSRNGSKRPAGKQLHLSGPEKIPRTFWN
ncbi:hypothetical protein CRE_13007 [Caenorhabditis remanei]|uniref:Uncharacterized protein n=1 Tax=Caenorhabditis remanei TaxID=31234 RepID=E3N174_CAERE|nr:hypothetical protein CRE_13007 [Caenorhabditis remanei]